ncbi:MAG: ketopantoate reductase family protein, partial [Fusobacteriaceae bacterium]
DNTKDFPELDIILMCTKSYDIEKTIKSIEACLKEKTLIIPLLNGMDIFERIRSATKKGVILPGCMYIFSWIESAGLIHHDGKVARMVFGIDLDEPKISVAPLEEILTKANIEYNFQGVFIYPEIWKKYIYIGTFAMLTASENKSTGQILEDPKLFTKMKNILTEISNVAKKKNINLPVDVVEQTINFAKKLPYNSYTSFHRDYQNPSKPNEKETLVHAIILLGEKLSVPTPTIKEVYEKLR